MRYRLVYLFTKWGRDWSSYSQSEVDWSSYSQSELTGPVIHKVSYWPFQLFTKWGIDWSSYLQSARCISNACGVFFWPQAAKTYNCKFTFSTLDNTESLFTGVDQLLLQANHMDLMILSTKRTSRVSDKHMSVSHMHNCLLISGWQHGSDDPEHEQNKPSVWQTHFSQSYAQVLTHFRPTTWICWSWAWTEQAKCLTNIFQSVIWATAYSFLANHKCTLVIILYATTCYLS